MAENLENLQSAAYKAVYPGDRLGARLHVDGSITHVEGADVGGYPPRARRPGRCAPQFARVLQAQRSDSGYKAPSSASRSVWTHL